MEVNVLFIYPKPEQSIYLTKNIICLQMEIITGLKTRNLYVITFSAHIRKVSEVFAQ